MFYWKPSETCYHFLLLSNFIGAVVTFWPGIILGVHLPPIVFKEHDSLNLMTPWLRHQLVQDSNIEIGMTQLH